MRPQVLGTWSARGTGVGDVLAATERLRTEAGSRATRTTVMTLVLVAADAGEATRAASAIHEFGERHPARTVILLIGEDGETSLDAQAVLHAHGERAWSEEMRLVVHGAATRHLDSLLEPLTLPDLPVVVWYVDHLPTGDDPLPDAADVLVVDARDLGDIDCFAGVLEVARRRGVVDLSWIRLRPWRELLAGLFDPADRRPHLHAVEAIEVRGKQGPRALLAGWLLDRLQLDAGCVRLGDGDHAGMLVETRVGGGATGRFEVARRGDERTVEATATIGEKVVQRSVLPLPPATPAWGLAEALTTLHPDPLYLRALSVAVTLPD